MPVGGLLEFVSDIQDFCFLHVVTDQLHADGQAILIKTRGNGHTGQAGQVEGHGIDIFQVHFHGVMIHRTQFGRGMWRGGTQDYVTLFKGCVKIVDDQAA